MIYCFTYLQGNQDRKSAHIISFTFLLALGLKLGTWMILCPVGSSIGLFMLLRQRTVLIHGIYRYFTILIPLNTIDENGGGTEIWDKSAKYSDLVIFLLFFFEIPIIFLGATSSWRRICLQWLP